jgi:hypothetical protein
MIAAHVSTVPRFAVTGRDSLFEGDFATSAGHQSYDVTRVGRQFLMMQPEAEEQVIMVLNWFTELRARIRASAPKQR